MANVAAVLGAGVLGMALVDYLQERKASVRPAPPPPPPPPPPPRIWISDVRQVLEGVYAERLLAVKADATSEDIQRAFRERVREVHPDLTGKDTAKPTRDVIWARDVLLRRASVPKNR